MSDASPAGNNVSIRSAEERDLPRLTELFDAYRVCYGQEPAAEQAEAYLRDRLQADDSQLFVAEAGGQLVGFVQLYPTLSSVAMRRVWILNDLFVAEESRRGGVASKLLERAEAFARETGAVRLELSTARDNRAAQALYEKHGWRRDEIFIHYFRGLE